MHSLVRQDYQTSTITRASQNVTIVGGRESRQTTPRLKRSRFSTTFGGSQPLRLQTPQNVSSGTSEINDVDDTPSGRQPQRQRKDWSSQVACTLRTCVAWAAQMLRAPTGLLTCGRKMTAARTT